jgi:hypothetical protein
MQEWQAAKADTQKLATPRRIGRRNPAMPEQAAPDGLGRVKWTPLEDRVLCECIRASNGRAVSSRPSLPRALIQFCLKPGHSPR